MDVIDENGRTALMIAAMHGSLPVLQILCAAGAELDIIDCDGKEVMQPTVASRARTPFSSLILIKS